MHWEYIEGTAHTTKKQNYKSRKDYKDTSPDLGPDNKGSDGDLTKLGVVATRNEISCQNKYCVLQTVQ